MDVFLELQKNGAYVQCRKNVLSPIKAASINDYLRFLIVAEP
jgi:hypothetical protein